jgi:outer membrane protein assembly factor BamB
MFRAQHDAPVDPGAVWSGYMGGTERAPFAEEPVPLEAPEILWSSEAGRGLSSSPVLSGEVLVASTTGRGIITLSAESGERFWEHMKDGPLTAAPVVDAERIYVSTNDVRGEVYALNRVDGSERWSRRHPGVNAPLLLDGERLYLATRSGYLSALNSDTGASIWSVQVGPGATAPVVAGDRVLVGTSRDSLFAVDAESGKIVDRRGLGAQISAAPAAGNGMLYLPLQSGEVAALRADDLQEAWRVRVDGPILAAPAVSRDGSVYVLDRTGAVHVVDRDGASRRLGAAGGVVTGSLVLAQNALVVGRVDGTLLALDRDDGSVLWSLRLGDSIHTPALLRDGVIFVPLRRGKVVKLQ